jgi:hypothetical protein
VGLPIALGACKRPASPFQSFGHSTLRELLDVALGVSFQVTGLVSVFHVATVLERALE